MDINREVVKVTAQIVRDLYAVEGVAWYKTGDFVSYLFGVLHDRGHSIINYAVNENELSHLFVEVNNALWQDLVALVGPVPVEGGSMVHVMRTANIYGSDIAKVTAKIRR